MTKRFIFGYLLLTISLIMSAQIIEDKEEAILEVQYLKTVCNDTIQPRYRSDPMTLRIGQTAAMFYPTKRMWSDSLLIYNFELYRKIDRELNPIGKIDYTPLGGLEREYLFRNVKDGETMVCRTVATIESSYTEPTEHPEWEIKEETKEVIGYTCQLATCNFRGRAWSAWFTTEIPINEGPWKLFGLPGLVLEACDSKGHYEYKAISLSTENLMPVGIKLYWREKPYKMKSRKDYLQKMYKEYITGAFAASMSALHGKSARPPRRSNYDYQETDYPHE